MDKKVIKILLNIQKYYNHFDNNQVVLGKLNEKYHSGDPVKIWMEAIEITNDMAAIEKGRYDMFLNIGNNWHEAKRYAVKKMVVYILENTTPNISETDKDEMRRMRNDLASLSYEYNTEELSCEFAAEPLQQTICFKKYLRDSVNYLLEIAKESDYDTLLTITNFVSDMNKNTKGALKVELNKCNVYLYNNLNREREIEKIEVPADKIFTEEQYKSTKIKDYCHIWVRAMYALLHREEYTKKEITHQDYCAAFLAVLRYNGEYSYDNGYDDFFNMMKELFKIDETDNDKKTIIRYVQHNKTDFHEWNSTPNKRGMRKKIAEELEKKMEEIKNESLKNM